MESKGVQVLERALDIIELLSLEKDGIGVTEIGVRLSLHKSTVHRLLNALGERGYIEKDTVRSNYRLGLKFVEIGSIWLNQLELKTEAAPYLRKLAETVRQPVHLAILRGSDAVYMEKIDPVSNLRLYSQIGKRIPVWCSALGKALLFDMGEPELHAFVATLGMEPFTDRTIRSGDALESQIRASAARGWAVDDEEHEPGIRCVAAPVRDYAGKIIAAVSASGDGRILAPERDAEHAALVMDTAGEISRRMGFNRR